MIKYFSLVFALILGGPITTIVAGSLSVPTVGFYDVFVLFAVVVIADLLGDTIYFLVGRFAGSKILSKIFKWRKISESKIIKINEYFKKYSWLAINLAKIIPNLGWPVIVLAGSFRINFLKFILYIVPISLIKSAVLIGLGYYIGKEANIPYEYLWIVIVPLVVFLIIRFIQFVQRG